MSLANDPNPTTTAAPSRGVILFLAVQVVVLFAGVGWAATRYVRLQAAKAYPPAHSSPLEVRPEFDYPQVVSDEQLQVLLHKLRPKFKVPKPNINHVDHALRMWGVGSKFNDPKCHSGEQMRNLLLNDEMFQKAWGKKTSPLLIDTDKGVKVRLQEGNSSMSHADHTLAVQAEVGTPLDHPVVTRTKDSSLGAMLEQSLDDFSLNQVEYEWSILAYALFYAPDGPGRTGEGQKVSFDDLSNRLMRQRMPEGVCFGNHRLHTLVMLLRLDDQSQHKMLSSPKRQEILEFLKKATAILVKNQSPEGYWDERWAVGMENATVGGSATPYPLTNRLLATGHALEWWSLAPEELHPPRETLVRAGQWYCKTVDEMTDEQIGYNFTFLSHGGRALAMWRKKLPAEVYVAPPHVEEKKEATPDQKSEESAKPPAEAEVKKDAPVPAGTDKKDADTKSEKE